MDREAHISAQQLQYIARISGGKDGFKMLDVIVSRGLPLDRITTTDIWATDTIRGEHPKMVEFKVRADEYIWRKYRIEVEHLCAMRNGKKVTYEQMFYHVPKRRRDAGGGRYQQGAIRGFPDLWHKWCQSDLKRGAAGPSPGLPSPAEQLVQEAQNRLCATGQASRKDFPCREGRGAKSSSTHGCRTSTAPFRMAPPRGAVKIS